MKEKKKKPHQYIWKQVDLNYKSDQHLLIIDL